MPRQNRVTPGGDLIAVPDRGLFWGNRGSLHDAAGRLVRPGVRRTYPAALSSLPDGVMVCVGDEPYLVRGGELLAWTPGGYRAAEPRPAGPAVTVITPRATVAVLAAGYRPAVHPSAA